MNPSESDQTVKEDSENEKQVKSENDSQNDKIVSHSEDAIQEKQEEDGEAIVEGEGLFDYIHDYIGVDMADEQEDSLIYDEPYINREQKEPGYD